MRKKSIISVVCLLLILGFSGGALAVTDPTGDEYVAGKDLQSAEVLLYAPPGASGTHKDFVRLSVGMAPGSTMPGMITWDFDADNNAATGGGSTLNMPFPPCPATRCKTDQGFDFFIQIVLRDQADTSQLAYCANCVGGQTCVERSAPIVCDEGDCYEPVDSCVVGDPDCWWLDTSTTCTNCAGGDDPSKYPLDVPCALKSENCGDGMKWGEYFVGSGQSGGKHPIYRGRVQFNDVDNVSIQQDYCFHLPWGDIVYYVQNKGILGFGDISQNPEYQVSVWHDADHADQNDMFDAGLILNLSDYVPDSGKATDAGPGADLCVSEATGDCNINIFDLIEIKKEYTRADCPNCCP